MKTERTSLIKMGNYIANKRKKKRYTQKQLAEIIDVGDKTISKWEQGDLAPDITLLKALAETLDTNINSLVNGEDDSSFRFSIFKNKRRLLFLCVAFTLLISMLSFFLGSSGRCEVYRLTSFNPFIVEGYLVNDGNQSIMMLGNIKVNETTDNIKNEIIESATMTVYSDGKVIESRYFKDRTTIEKFLNDNHFLMSTNTKINKEDIKIKYEFLNSENNKFEYYVNF